MGAQGHVLLDFGAFPGASDATYTVTVADLSVTGLVATSDVEAWIEPAATADHSADEHMVETLEVFADKSSIVAGTSFVVRGFNTSQFTEPILSSAPGEAPLAGGRGTRLYGKWNVGVAWN